MPRDPQDIYARQLLSRRGYPLWTPEPSRQLLALREDGLRIGDVGVVIPEDGCFDVFFNICLPSSHPFHRTTGVPDNFEPIQLDNNGIRTTARAENPGCIHASSSVKRVRIERSGDDTLGPIELDYGFGLSSKESALLILPEGAERHDLRDHHRFLETATQHATDWYRFAEERVGQIIGHDSLYLITGFYKARSWSLAAFEKTEGSAQYPAQFKYSQHVGDHASANYSWDTMRTLDWRVGPLEDYVMPNQAVFIRGFKIALRSGMFGTRWISVKTDAPSTRSNPAQSFGGTVPRDSWLGYLFAGMSTSEASGSGARDEVLVTDPALGAARNEIENNGALAVGENVVIHRIPGSSQVFHPSDVINQYLFKKDPSADVAITHDNDWISILEEDLLQPEELAQEGHLEAVVSQKYVTISKGGAIYLESRSGSPRPGEPSDFEAGSPGPKAIFVPPSEGRFIKRGFGVRELDPVKSKPNHTPLTALSGHDGQLMFVEFISNGQIISASDKDGTIRQWTFSDGQWRNEVLKEGMDVCAVATSPDHRWIAYCGINERVELIHLETREVTNELNLPHYAVQSLSFSPGSHQLAGGMEDGTVCLWSLTPPQLIARTFENPKDSVWCVRYSPDGKKVASCNRQSIQVLGTATHTRLTITEQARSLAWIASSETCFLLAGCTDGTLRRFNPDTGETLTVCKAHRDVISSIVLAHSAKFIATASWDKTVRFWEVDTFQEMTPCLQHDVAVHSISISPNDNYLVSGALDPTLRVWNLKASHPTLFEPSRPPVLPKQLKGSSYMSAPDDPHITNIESQIPTSSTPHRPTETSSNLLSPGGLFQVAPTVMQTTSRTSGASESDNTSLIRKIRSRLPRDLSGKIIPEGSEPVTVGSRHDIYRGTLNIDGSTLRVAIKVIKKSAAWDDDESIKRCLRQEIKRWSTLEHSCVLPLLGTSTDYGAFEALVCPWVEDGALTTYLDSYNNDLTTLQRFWIINDVALGLEYLHSRAIVHGDISGAKVLIYESGRACITDSSASFFLTDLLGYEMALNNRLYGKLCYRAPELLGINDEIHPTTQSDIYSFGGIMFHTLSGKQPYHDLQTEGELMLAKITGKHPRRPETATVITDDQWEFMTRCWLRNPKARPSDSDVVKFVHGQLLDAMEATSTSEALEDLMGKLVGVINS